MSTESLFTFQRTLLVLLPETILVLTAVILITAAPFLKIPRQIAAIISALSMLAALAVLFLLRDTGTDAIAYGAVALNDALSGYSRLVFLITGLILLALAYDQVGEERACEFFGSLLLVNAGAMLVAASNELVFLFVGLELVSIPTYLLLYLPRRTPSTQEAVTKYFYLSVFSSALLLFGLAYLYGLTGVGNFKAVGYLLHSVEAGSAGQAPVAFGVIAILFVMAGLGFRVAAVPFHFYAPDVYQGAPTIIAAMLAWVPKGVGFVAMLRVLTTVVGGGGELAEKAVLLTWILAVATMVLGNTMALVQNDLKRLLAYSSIAHAGYLLIGITVAFVDPISAGSSPYLGSQGVLFYLGMYSLMTLGAFGVILALSSPMRPVEAIDDLAGLGRTRPLAALAMALCLFSLAGIPPLAGFWGKFSIFASALSVEGSESTVRLFRLLAVIGVVNAAIGAYYYLRIVVVMYLRNPQGAPLTPRAGWPAVLAIGTCASLSLLLGLYPDPINRASREAALHAMVRPEPVVLVPVVPVLTSEEVNPAEADVTNVAGIEP